MILYLSGLLGDDRSTRAYFQRRAPRYQGQLERNEDLPTFC
jgi:hypothetical protein